MWRHEKRRKSKLQWQLHKQHSQIKKHKRPSYACHICGLNGHKMTKCPKFVEMQKMFHGKFVIVAEVQHVAETQTIIVDVNVVDVNVTIRNKVTKEHVFKDRKPSKAKSVVD